LIGVGWLYLASGALVVHAETSGLVAAVANLARLLGQGTQRAAVGNEAVGHHAALKTVFLTNLAAHRHGAADRTAPGGAEVRDAALVALDGGLLLSQLADGAAPRDQKGESVNLNTAKRFDYIANVENLRTTAKPNLCLFRCTPVALPFKLRMLEKHHFSNQMFSPLNAERYLVVVCLGEDLPDLSTLGVFVADGKQAINYNPAVWHHPMIALDNEIDFVCLVHEDGGDDDCMALLVDWENIIVHVD